ncbi:MAG TPA: hypothetical protein VHX64_07895 [Caulobacteraceae bacterium]|nr:hypothetical protein [Caulobacteraceae bacterium]
MRKTIAALGAALGLLTAGAAYAQPATIVPPTCERECLKGFIDRYIAAMVAHDPKSLPVSYDVKFTENGQELQLGDGLWGTIQSQGDYKLYFVDPETQEAGFFGTVIESGRQDIIGIRLHIQAGNKISQIETQVSRASLGGGPGGGKPPVMTPKPIFYEDVPPAQRRSRQEMVAIADSYFEGLEHATETMTPFDPNCQRLENGMVTANNPDAPPGMSRMSCGAQFATHFSPFISHVRERRYPIVDQEKGLVLAIAFFDHNGRIKDVKLTDGSNLHVPPPFDAPFAFELFELFKIQDGKIMRVEAVLNTVPYGMKAGW